MSQRRGKASGATAVAAPAASAAAGAPTIPATSTTAVRASSSLPPARPSLAPSVLVFTAVFALYASTAYPSVTGGDSGELIVTTCTRGIAHPPGYPLYTMLGVVWSEIMRYGHRAYRMNILSCILGSIAAAAIAATTTMLASRTSRWSGAGGGRAWSGATVAGVYAGVGFACMPTVWLYSIQGEVFALNNALVSLLLFLTVRYYAREEKVDREGSAAAHSKKGGEGSSADVVAKQAPTADGTAAATGATFAPALAAPSSRSLVPLALGGAFLCGVCLTNQHTTVFPVLVTSAFISWSLWARGQLGLVRVVQLVLAVLVGMSPYAYILMRSHWRVADSWGDQRTLSGFLTHLLREEYGTFQLAASELSSDPGMVSRLQVYGANMRSEMMLLTPLLSLLGVLACARSASRAVRRSALVLALSFLLYVLVFHKLANLDLRPLFLGVQARFWQQSNIYVYVFSGVGLMYAAECVGAMFPARKHTQSQAPASVSTGGTAAPSLLLVSLYSLSYLSLQLYLQYPVHNHRSNDSFYRAGVAMLESFPPHSIVLLNGDLNNNMLKYPQQCEGVRPDLSLLSLQLMSWDWFVPVQRENYPNVTFPGIRYHVSTPRSFNIKKFLDANVAPAGTAGKGAGKKKPKSPGGVFLCGPFKDGDHSNVRARGSDGSTTASWYEEHPFGLCNQLLPSGSAPANLSSFLRRGWEGLVRTEQLPPFRPWQFGEETWEHVLYRDNWTRLLYLASYASFHANQRGDDTAMLRLAWEITEEVWRNQEVLRQQKMLGAYEYRSAGVIYGLWAKHLRTLPPRSHPHAEEQAGVASRRLFYSWLRYTELQPGDAEIAQFVRDRVNPYTMGPVEGIERDSEFQQYKHLLRPHAHQPVSATANKGNARTATDANKKASSSSAGKTQSKTKKK